MMHAIMHEQQSMWGLHMPGVLFFTQLWDPKQNWGHQRWQNPKTNRELAKQLLFITEHHAKFQQLYIAMNEVYILYTVNKVCTKQKKGGAM